MEASKKSIFVLLFALILNSLTFSQDLQKKYPINFNIGLSFMTGGLGGNIEYFPLTKITENPIINNIAILGGAGIMFGPKELIYMGWSIGTKFYINRDKSSLYAGVVLSPTGQAARWVGGDLRDTKIYYGLSGIAGYRLLINNKYTITLGGGFGIRFGELTYSFLGDVSRFYFAPDLTVGIKI